jgi:pimeloyl-ACP methyl ester carboxylesterase
MHYVVYVPGLGDHNTKGQARLLGAWRLWGVKPVLVHMLWADKQPFAPKLERLLAKIDELAADGNAVSLVGASAGASAALAAFAARKDNVHKVILLCGEVKVGVRIKQSYQDENPAFVESMNMLGATLGQLGDSERARIRSYHPIFDETVPVGDTKIDGVASKRMCIVGHPFGIGYGLTIGAPAICRWLKR